MSKQIFVAARKQEAVPAVGEYLIDWCVANPEAGLGGATGRSPIDVWDWVWRALDGDCREAREAVVGQRVMFLDEYFGGFPSYYHWAHRNLRSSRGGIPADQIFTPRGCFFENNRIVNSQRLEEMLDDWEEEWQPRTEPGEDGQPPEVHINDSATHPMLVEIREAMGEYDRLVREHDRRLQLLGIGVGGAVDFDPGAGGHIGFVEYGAAAGDSRTMLARLAPSTAAANRDDFQLRNADGAVSLEPSRFAVTQGISTILSAGALLLMAWGGSKQQAVRRMFLGQPGPKNPASWVQTHDCVRIFLDRQAFGDLRPEQLAEHGWKVVFLETGQAVSL